MNTVLVDSHCHLDLMNPNHYGGDVSVVLDNARSCGVEHVLNACVDLDAYAKIHHLAQKYPNVFISLGVHPNHRPEHEPTPLELAALANTSRVVAVGETGLDYYRSSGELEWQRARFRNHIAAAKAAGKPLIVHCRSAKEDVLQILEEEGADAVGGVMHCFAEDWETACRAVELNFCVSFSGIVTYKNTDTLQQVAMQMPLDRLLVETDSPYLAPVPYRGRPNQPAYVRIVAAKIAELRGVALEVIAEATTQNFFRLFRNAAASTHTAVAR